MSAKVYETLASVTYICMHLHNRSCLEIAELQRLSKASKGVTFLKEQRRQHVKTATHEPECKRTGNNNTSKQQPTNLNANTFTYGRPTGMKPLCVCATPCLRISARKPLLSKLETSSQRTNKYATPTCGELSTPVNYSAAMIPRLYNTLCETVNHNLSLHFPRTLLPDTSPHKATTLHYTTLPYTTLPTLLYNTSLQHVCTQHFPTTLPYNASLHNNHKNTITKTPSPQHFSTQQPQKTASQRHRPQHFTTTLLHNTRLQHFTTQHFPTQHFQHFSTTLPYNTSVHNTSLHNTSNTSLQHCSQGLSRSRAFCHTLLAWTEPKQ